MTLSGKRENSLAAIALWLKRQRPYIPDLPPGSITQPYCVFRSEALAHREQALKGQCAQEMELLYKFWSHFLAHNFNNSMYSEFFQLAVDDLRTRSSEVGFRYLVDYYCDRLYDGVEVPDSVLDDYLCLAVDARDAGSTLAFDRLREMWRENMIHPVHVVTITELMEPLLEELLG